MDGSELQLALALSTNPHFDLNYRAYDDDDDKKPHHLNKKRSFSQLFVDHSSKEVVTLPTTLPLLPLTPNHHDDDDDDHDTQQHPATNNCSNTITNKSDDGDDDDDDDIEGPVGWPPVNSWRKRLRYDNCDDDEVAGGNIIDPTVWIHHHDHDHDEEGLRHDSVGLCRRGRGSNIRLSVKVKMEGVGIARKVDLSVHHSFQTLKETLFHMFGKCHNRFSKCYELAYQDEEGDWLLAEDVPWRNFIQCAQRLKLLKIRAADI